jgi:hypothetical protein
VSAIWPWLMLAGLGAFHGVNPAMGWLFAVARGMQRGSAAAVLFSMLPIAAGHALSIAMIILVLQVLGAFLDLRWIAFGAAFTLIGFGIFRLFARHRGRTGMQVGAIHLLLWSFLMASAHGAGLMLVPVLLQIPLCRPFSHVSRLPTLALAGSAAHTAIAAVSVHTVAMLAAAGAVGIIVYEWAGLAFLRRAWINLDLIWVVALISAGLIVLGMELF